MNLSDFNCFTFPGGERHFQVDNPEDVIDQYRSGILRAPLLCSDDIMDLWLVTGYLRRIGREPLALHVPYVPYARQDRATTEGSPCSIKMMADIINFQGYRQVWMYEPHSDVTPALIRVGNVVGCEEACREAVQNIVVDGDLTLIAPDAGASKRVDRCHSYIQTMGWDALEPHIAQATKHRDPSTGRLTLGEIYTPSTIVGQNFLIVDDICDGGATFTALAKRLNERGAASVHLFVAHGIFSKGFDVLFDAGIDTIHYTDSRDKTPLERTEVSPCGRIFKYRCGL